MSNSPRFSHQMSATLPGKASAVLQQYSQWVKYIDWRILLLVAVLSSFGVIAVTSASMSIAHENIGDPWFYTKRYVIYWFMGFVGAPVHRCYSNGDMGEIWQFVFDHSSGVASLRFNSGAGKTSQWQSALVAVGAACDSSIRTGEVLRYCLLFQLFVSPRW